MWHWNIHSHFCQNDLLMDGQKLGVLETSEFLFTEWQRTKRSTPFMPRYILYCILIDRGCHWSIIHVRSFRGAECDTDHYLVVAKFRERLAVIKQAAQNPDRG